MLDTGAGSDPTWWRDAVDGRRDRARERAAGGVPVVGYVGADVPGELVEAAGACPVRLSGIPGRTSAEADRLLGAAVDPAVSSVLAQLLDGDWRFLTGLVVSRDSQASLALFYVLRELRRLEPGLQLPPVHLLDLLHLPRASTTRYDAARVAQLAEVLAGWTGTAVTGDGLARAVAGARRVRSLLRDAQRLRRADRPGLSGTTALHVHGAVTAMPGAEAAERLGELLAAAAAGPALPARPRLFLTGSAQDHDRLYVAVEDEGWHVVGEDHDRGDLALTVDVPGWAGTDEIARAYQHRGPAAATSSIRAHAEWTAAEAAACRADLLLAVVREHDEAPAWDLPVQRERAAALGIGTAALLRQPYVSRTSDVRAVLATASAATRESA
ncbi:2-hydroxyacyl-CoA dehydratase family protein [Geodermatophilus nigrescens]|uniref:Benzoyl-CoA reductase/2-hydroxyglutaryl-CoA dehydratase subunit, BcrC/BadD/HgdB n=1 Tax=Geodermatophilus nigrescens TaxID=1070870 RepID=A0A1M5HIM9_9ACTN|nr:2-hydroxyacyl-CoA dehydratase family protein [Geodermatophilus nigrescens]SHG15795.1 Benzoyl-CoA reductase/2-hydroxyglutaryl-CoA dehydratase subunit, BcrC/BadD/HgdB [Geodermatophilus nigrescens]